MTDQGQPLSPKLLELKEKYQADPSSRIFLQLAEEYRKANLNEDGVQVCLAGLQHHAGYTTARVTLARCYLALKRNAEAQAELEKVIAQVPDNLLANRHLGDLYYESGNHAQALERYRVVGQLNSGDLEITARIAELEGTPAGVAGAPGIGGASPVARARDVFGPRPSAPPVVAIPVPPPSKPTADDDFGFMDLKMDESLILNADMVQAALASAGLPVEPRERPAAIVLTEKKIPEGREDFSEVGGEDSLAADDFSDFSSPTVMMNTADLARMAGIEPEAAHLPVSEHAASPVALARNEVEISSPSAAESAVGSAVGDHGFPIGEVSENDDFAEFSAPTVMMNVQDLIKSGALGPSEEAPRILERVASPEAHDSPAPSARDYGTHMIPIEEIQRAAANAREADRLSASSVNQSDVDEQPFADSSQQQSPVTQLESVDEDPFGTGESGDFGSVADAGDPFDDLPETSPVDFSEALAGKTLGDLYLQQGHLEKALEVFERYLREHPDDAEVGSRVASVRARLNPRDTAPVASGTRPVQATAFAPPAHTPSVVAPPAAAPPAAAPPAAATPAVAPLADASPVADGPSTTVSEGAEDRKKKLTKLSNWLASLKKP